MTGVQTCALPIYNVYGMKARFSGIELICEFLRTMLNHNQFLLSIVCYSFYLFLSPVCQVCRSFNFGRKRWRVQVANLHNGARALSCPSRCQKLEKYFSPSFVLRCYNTFRQRYKATTVICVSSAKWNFILGK